MFLCKGIKLADCEDYIRTWSSFHVWQQKHLKIKKRRAGGKGNVIDEMFGQMVSSEPQWQINGDWKDVEVDMEWGSGLVLARRR